MTALQRHGRVLSAAVLSALVAGFVVNGLGSRLAMRVLAYTSDPALRGALTENENRIREFTLDGTMGLVVFVTLASTLLGFFYVFVRRWLPEDRRVLWAAALGLAIGAWPLANPKNRDFEMLSPRPLAILLFAALPALFGAALAALDAVVEPRFLAARGRGWPAVAVLLPLVVVLPFGAVSIPVIAVSLAVVFVAARSETLRRAWESRGVQVGGRVVLAVASLAGLIELGRRTALILTA